MSKSSVSRVALYLFLALVVISFLVPVYVMLNQGLKSYEELNRATMWVLPKSPTVEGFAEAWKTMAPYMRNSLYMAIPATLISCILGMFNG